MKITIENNGKTATVEFTTVAVAKSVGRTADAPTVDFVVDFSQWSPARMATSILKKCVAVESRTMTPVPIPPVDASIDLRKEHTTVRAPKSSTVEWTVDNIFEGITPSSAFNHAIHADADVTAAYEHCMQFSSVPLIFDGLRASYAQAFQKR